LVVAGVTVDASTLAVNGLTASAAELNETFLHLDIPDGSADATHFLVAPHAGDITKIYTVIDGAVSTADITVTAKIGATGITNGVVTIATAGSAAGDVDSATPTAANTVTAGQAVNFVVAGGGSGGSPRIHLVAVLTR
jgi:copper homeostasis protein CutC